MEDPIAKYFCTIDHSMEHYKVIGIGKVHGDQILCEEKETIIGTETKDVWTKTLKFWKDVDFYTFSIFYCLMINNWIRHRFQNLETASPKCISMECVV